MAGYVKRIALIRTLKSGYSQDGGPLKGLVRCEAYAGHFRAEASLINFAPLCGATYRAAVSDGASAVIFEPPLYEGEGDFDPSCGFACLIAACSSGEVKPVACAVCGDNDYLLAALQSAMEAEERPAGAAYNDEAIASENYYELEDNEVGGAVRQAEGQKEGRPSRQDEDVPRPLPREEAEGGKSYGGERCGRGEIEAAETSSACGREPVVGPLPDDKKYEQKEDVRAGEISSTRRAPSGAGGAGEINCPTSAFRIGGTPDDNSLSADGAEQPPRQNVGEGGAPCGSFCDAAPCGDGEENGSYPAGNDEEGEGEARAKLAENGFYERMYGDIKKIFATYPRAGALEDVIEGSRWARISYGNGRHYAFGVIYDGGNAKYICYGVPVEAGAPCPKSLEGRAAYVPVDGGGYWVMYQDAASGISLEAK